MPSKLDSALALARRGFRVFPLPVDDQNVPAKELKTPRLKNWTQLATADKKRIREWWAEADYNIGLATGQGVVVLDYDMKEGQLGAQALRTHDMLGLPLDGFNVTTPTGGKHYYFKTPNAIGNSASKIAKNVDVRGDGGYVVAPGSTIHGVPYSADGLSDIKDLDALPELPDWMEKLATAVRTKSTVDAKESLVELDQPSQIAAATQWLQAEAPEALEGSGGDATTYKVACRVRDFGVSKQTCLELLAEHWNDEKAIPSWTVEELEQKIHNAYNYATLPAGSADAKGELGVVDISDLEDAEPSETAPKPKKLFWVSAEASSDMALEANGEPLIENLLDAGGLSATYGRSNQGKTFVVLDFMFHVAAGLPWNGNDTKQGLVVYIAAEGGFGIHKRIRALKQQYGWEGQLPLVIVPCPINLLDKTKDGDTASLVKLIRQVEEAYGQKAIAIVVDTLSRALAGGDENSSTDMGTFVRHIDKIRAATKAHLMIVHHAGKDQAKGMRGWSGMQAALDTEIEVHEGRITVTKQRDMEMIEPINFVLRILELGTDQRGRRVTSCVIDVSKEAIARAEMDLNRISTQDEKVLRVMQAIWSERKKDDKTRQKAPISNAEISVRCVDMGLFREAPDAGQLSRLLSTLVDTKSIRKVERGQWVVVGVDQVDKVDNSDRA
jgi:hypothetical protein